MRVIECITNSGVFDQRLQKKCKTLQDAGYRVTLIGIYDERFPNALKNEDFDFKTLKCLFKKGFVFYAEYNIRLFFLLLFATYDLLVANDADTLPAVALASLLRRKKMYYDSHEYFIECPEIRDRRLVKSFWDITEIVFAIRARKIYTVGASLAEILSERFGKKVQYVRNVPTYTTKHATDFCRKDKILIYQGVLNVGRGIEQIIDALEFLPEYVFYIVGEGDISEDLRTFANSKAYSSRIIFYGFVKPSELKNLTAKARYGLNLLESNSMNYYYSLANKFFDYIHAGVPCITMDFPEYRNLYDQRAFGILLEDFSTGNIASAIQNSDHNENIYANYVENCHHIAREINWENESIQLLKIYEKNQD
jgi:glycosyltransferase involved in cell wall biosynthesis